MSLEFLTFFTLSVNRDHISVLLFLRFSIFCKISSMARLNLFYVKFLGPKFGALLLIDDSFYLLLFSRSSMNSFKIILEICLTVIHKPFPFHHFLFPFWNRRSILSRTVNNAIHRSNIGCQIISKL